MVEDNNKHSPYLRYFFLGGAVIEEEGLLETTQDTFPFQNLYREYLPSKLIYLQCFVSFQKCIFLWCEYIFWVLGTQ